MRTRIQLILIALVALLAIVGTGYVILDGIRVLVSSERAASSFVALAQLVGLSVLSGVFAFAAVDFLKRTSALRAPFNRRAIRAFFGDLSGIVRDQGGQDLNITEPRSIEARLRVQEIGYDVSIRQLTAQLAQAFRGAVPVGPDRSRPVTSE